MMTPLALIRAHAVLGAAVILLTIIAVSPTAADNGMSETTPHSYKILSPEGMSAGSQCQNIPLLMAEGSNSCEIVSCGMGIKDTCKITCPADKTPKCSCDCLKNFGPMCTEYKANCKCE